MYFATLVEGTVMHITRFWNTNHDARTSNPTIHDVLTLQWALQAFVTLV